MLDPTIGRWTSEDPLGLEPDVDPYRYVHNDPTNYTDPTGLEDEGLPKDLEQGMRLMRLQKEVADLRRQFKAQPNEAKRALLEQKSQELDRLMIEARKAQQERNDFLFGKDNAPLAPLPPVSPPAKQDLSDREAALEARRIQQRLRRANPLVNELYLPGKYDELPIELRAFFLGRAAGQTLADQLSDPIMQSGGEIITGVFIFPECPPVGALLIAHGIDGFTTSLEEKITGQPKMTRHQAVFAWSAEKALGATPEEAKQIAKLADTAYVVLLTSAGSLYGARLADLREAGLLKDARALENELILRKGRVPIRYIGSIEDLSAVDPVGFLKNMAKRKDVDPDGFLDVVLHSNQDFCEIAGRAETPEYLAQVVAQDPKCTGKVRLLGCLTGNTDTQGGKACFAQRFADALKDEMARLGKTGNVEVQGTNGMWVAFEDGTHGAIPAKKVDGKWIADQSASAKPAKVITFKPR